MNQTRTSHHMSWSYALHVSPIFFLALPPPPIDLQGEGMKISFKWHLFFSQSFSHLILALSSYFLCVTTWRGPLFFCKFFVFRPSIFLFGMLSSQIVVGSIRSTIVLIRKISFHLLLTRVSLVFFLMWAKRMHIFHLSICHMQSYMILSFIMMTSKVNTIKALHGGDARGQHTTLRILKQ